MCVQWFPAMKSIAAAKDEEQKKALIEEMGQGLVLLEDAYGKISKGKAFFGGDQIGYLDIAIGAFLAWLRVTEKLNGVKLLDESKIPGLMKWAEIFSSDPAVKDVLPETEKLAGFAKALIAKLRGTA
uniref:glutathione transferase n=1 Tax=Rhizophora mucronata TaxID=61149 RepID=A0A2P2J5A5_RHIMU